MVKEFLGLTLPFMIVFFFVFSGKIKAACGLIIPSALKRRLL
jgi:hypothetical protein